MGKLALACHSYAEKNADLLPTWTIQSTRVDRFVFVADRFPFYCTVRWWLCGCNSVVLESEKEYIYGNGSNYYLLGYY